MRRLFSLAWCSVAAVAGFVTAYKGYELLTAGVQHAVGRAGLIAFGFVVSNLCAVLLIRNREFIEADERGLRGDHGWFMLATKQAVRIFLYLLGFVFCLWFLRSWMTLLSEENETLLWVVCGGYAVLMFAGAAYLDSKNGKRRV